MKNSLENILILLFITGCLTVNGQTKSISNLKPLKLEIKPIPLDSPLIKPIYFTLPPIKPISFDPPPIKPLFFELNAIKKFNIKFVDGKTVWVEETDAEYNKRNAEYKKKHYEDYINSERYKKWEQEYNEWKKRHPDQKETLYSDSINSQQDQTPVKPEPSPGKFYKVTTQTLDVRSGPGMNKKIIATLKIDDIVQLIKADTDWWQVKTGKIKGYVDSQFLAEDPFGDWEKLNYRSGEIDDCSNVTPKCDNNIDNYLKINVGSNTDVVVKLMKINNYSEECIRIVYIISSDTFRIRNIPEGRYILKIAYGKDYRKKIIDKKCHQKFVQNALYQIGKDTLDFNLIRKPDQIIEGGTIQNREIPCYELFLSVLNIDNKNLFYHENIDEEEFNK